MIATSATLQKRKKKEKKTLSSHFCDAAEVSHHSHFCLHAREKSSGFGEKNRNLTIKKLYIP
jgi:hypothetical protein